MTNWCVAPGCENGYKPKKKKAGEKEKGDVDGAAEGKAREAEGGEENSSKESNKVKKKVSLFGFPEEKDEPGLRKKWLARLPQRTNSIRKI